MPRRTVFQTPRFPPPDRSAFLKHNHSWCVHLERSRPLHLLITGLTGCCWNDRDPATPFCPFPKQTWRYTQTPKQDGSAIGPAAETCLLHLRPAEENCCCWVFFAVAHTISTHHEAQGGPQDPCLKKIPKRTLFREETCVAGQCKSNTDVLMYPDDICVLDDLLT